MSNRALEELPEILFSSYEVGKRNVVIDLGGSSSDNPHNNWWGGEPLTKLLLADNHLSTIPERLASTFPNLISLDLHGNKLVLLPDNTEQWVNLTSLNLSRNGFTLIPSSLSQLSLVELFLSHNQITSFFKTPGTTHFFSELGLLDLSHNKLTELSSDINQLQKLRKLNLGYNQISSLHESFLGWPLLEELDLSNNRLTQVPFFPSDVKEFGSAKFPKLITLNLQNNKLSSIDFKPESKLSELKQLMLSNNLLNSTGQVLHNLPQLIVLTLSGNRINSFPEEILDMKGLTQLDLSVNNITRIPPQIGNLASITSLNISGNPLRATPKFTSTEEFLKTMRGRIPPSSPPLVAEMSKLNISTNQPIKGGVESKNATGLKLSHQEVSSRTVRLSNQKIDDLVLESKFTEELPFQPCSLEFNKNLLTKAPNQILELYSESLTSIDISMNHLTSFVINKPLPHLKTLNLGGNRLTSFPLLEEGPPLLPSLETLDVSVNRITNLPLNPHPNLPSLTTLLMSGNQVSDLAQSLPFITSLLHLDISNNNVKQVPPQLAAPGSKLIGISLLGNPFLFPRYQIISRGSSYILEYLRSRIPPPQ